VETWDISYAAMRSFSQPRQGASFRRTSIHPDAQLAADAIRIAAMARGGRCEIDGVIFHTDRGSTYTASSFTVLCKDRLGIRQSMGRVGSCFDNAAAESFFLHPGA